MNKDLIANLKLAVEKLKGLGDYQDMLSQYDSAADLAAFIESQTVLLEKGSITKEDFEELWTIFAPISEWDDYMNDTALGEAIFRELEIIKNTEPK